MALGRDGKGYVRGMGGGVSKTEIRASGPCREIIRKERQQYEMMNNDIITLKEQVATLTQTVHNNTSRSSHQSQEPHSTSQGAESNVFQSLFLEEFEEKTYCLWALEYGSTTK